MGNQIVISLAIFLLVIAGFISRKFPMAFVSMTGFILMVVFGILDSETALGYFAKDTWIIISSLCIISAAFSKTTYVNKMAVWLAKKCNGSIVKIMICYILVELILSQFISSTIARFSMEYPLLIASCQEMKVNRSRVIYPLAVVTMCDSGILPTTAAVSMAIRISPLLEAYGMPEWADFSIMQYCISRIVIAAIIIPIAIFILPQIMPDRYEENFDQAADADANALLGKNAELSPLQEKVVAIDFLIVCLGFAFNKQINAIFPLPLWVIAILGALLVVAFGILKDKELFNNMGMRVILLALGATGLGAGLASSGAADLIGDLLIQVFGTHPNGFVVCWVFFMISAILSNLITNPPVVWAFIPIAIIACKAFGAQPLGIVFMLISSTQCGFMMPTASVVASTMFPVGGYELGDILKRGIPLLLATSIIYTLIIMLIFPFYA